MVFNDNEAIYCLVRSILHPSLRTKASVLVLLAAICLVKGGHELIVSAFDRFKKVRYIYCKTKLHLEDVWNLFFYFLIKNQTWVP